MKLSVILPTIRIDKLQNWYNSLINSYSDEFELIVISPYELPPFLKDKSNIKYINDWGSPLRAQQLALLEVGGEYIHRAVDDSLYMPDAMNKAMDKLTGATKEVVNIKFYEGENQTHRNMADPQFYYLQYHVNALKPYVPFDFQVINFGIYPHQLLLAVGGWNAEKYETIAFGELDLSLRLQFYGVKPILTDNIAIKVDWLPGPTGDHGPLHFAFADDEPKYTEEYSQPECELHSIIDINNWQKSPERWVRRFGNV